MVRLCSMVCWSVRISRVGFSGASYGAVTPVKFLISPVRAFLYKPFTSRVSQTERGALMNTSMKLDFPMMNWACWRAWVDGLMVETMVMKPLWENSLAISETRRMFSFRSSWVKPKSEFMPARSSSPSRIWTKVPLWVSLLFRRLGEWFCQF